MEIKKSYILLLVFTVLLSWSLLQAQWYRDYEIALQKLSDGQYQEALEKINQAIAREGKPQHRKRAQSTRYISYFPYLVRGKINYYLGFYEQSLKDFETCKMAGEVFLDPDGKREWSQFNEWALIKMSSEFMKDAIYWFNAGDLVKARQGFEKVLAVDSINPTPKLFLRIIDGAMKESLNGQRLENKSFYELEEGKKLFARGRFQEAIVRFSVALAFDSSLTEAAVFRQRAEKSLEQIQMHLARETELSGSQKRKAALLDTLNIGLTAYTQGDYAKAEEILQLVVKSDPQNKLAVEFLERCRAESRPVPEKTTEEKEMDQKLSALQAQLESVNQNNIRREKTITLIEKLNRGLEAFARNDFKGAVKILEEVVKEDPGLTVAVQYLELGRKAMKKPQEVTEGQKDTLGQRLAELQTQITGLSDESRRQKQQLELLNQINNGVSALSRGEYESAISLFEKVLRENPNLTTAKDFLALAQQNYKQSQEIKTISQEYKTVQGEYEKLKVRMDSVAQSNQSRERNIALMEKLNRGLEAFARNDFKGSVKILEEVVKEDPGLTVAVQYLELGRKAMKKPQEVTEGQKDTLGQRLAELQTQITGLNDESRSQKQQLELLNQINNGVSALSRGEYEGAISLFEKVLLENPNLTTAKDFLALAQQNYKQSQEIKTISQEYKTVQGEYEKLKVRMDSVAQSNQSRERNIALMEKLNQGLVAYANNNYETAVLVLAQVLKDDPSQTTAAKYLGLARQTMTQPPQSPAKNDSLNRALNSEIDNLQDKLSSLSDESRSQQRQLAALKRMNEGMRALSRQDFGQAVALFRAVLEENPDMTIAGDYLAVAEQQYSSSQEVKKAQEIQAKRIQTEMEEGLAMISSSNYQEALLHFNVVQALDPGNVSAGRYAEQAKKELEKIELQRQRMQEQDTEASRKMEERKKLLNEALVLFTSHKFAEAQTVFQKMVESFPEDKQAQDLLAECKREIEKENEEKRQTEMFSELKQKGLKYFESRDYEKARDALWAAWGREPENQELKGLIAQCELNLSKKQEGTFFHITNLKKGMTFLTSKLELDGVAFNHSGISNIEIKLNANKIGDLKSTGAESGEDKGKITLNYPLLFQEGFNRLVLVCHAQSGATDSTSIDSIFYYKPTGKVYAALFGVAEYEKINHLNYTVNDVEGFKAILQNMGIPSSQIFCFENKEVTVQEMRTLLGSKLKNVVQPEDQVIIYFSGHGGYEAEAGGNNADGFEKYLLPYNADPNDYYGTAYPMSEIANISGRLKAGQVFFIIDACYSGATGSKSFVQTPSGVSFSQEYLDRVSNRAGRIIFTASGSNEPSLESEAIKHGIFTYYLIEGLKGSADMNKDKLVSINELNEFVAAQVRKWTNGRQTPVFKGSFSGTIYLGRLEGL